MAVRVLAGSDFADRAAPGAAAARRRRTPVPVVRAVGAVTTIAAAAVALTGCFMIPLADGRSPFDDPFGPSFRQVRAHLPALQDALDEALPDGDWVAVASVASHNCEGACALHLGVDLSPAPAPAEAAVAAAPDEAATGWIGLAVPSQTLAAILAAGAPVAADAKLDLTVTAQCLTEPVLDAAGAEVTPCADITDASQAITGSDDPYYDDPVFSVSRDELTLNTSTWASDVILSRLE
jgi:hypothetical protein